MRPGTILRVLRDNPAFARLFAAQLISFAGDWLATVALLGLALELTGSAAVTSLVLVLQNGPFFLVAPFAGAVADRFDRRTVMVIADLARVGVCIGFLVARDPATLWIAFVCAALLAIFAAFFDPATSASIPNLVAPGDLGPALALGGAAWGTMLAVGAAVRTGPTRRRRPGGRRLRAEGVGFEPTVGCPTMVFETIRFGRSRTPPGRRIVVGVRGVATSRAPVVRRVARRRTRSAAPPIPPPARRGARAPRG